MLCKANSVGVFQVESRAQMSMLPRLKPQRVLRPRRRGGDRAAGPDPGRHGASVPEESRSSRRRDPLSQDSGKLKAILKRTRGVPLFQEQAMQIAIDCAGFLPAKADKLRRAMATFRRSGTIHKLKDDFINGMVGNNYEREFAERCFKQIEGFGEYGFPESHAASFAILVYVSSWVKYYLPRGLRRRPAQLPADGLLCAGAARARCPRARASKCGRPTSTPATGTARWRRPTSGAARCGWASGRSPASRKPTSSAWSSGAPRPIAIRPICGGAAGSASARSWRWRAPTPSPRWA